MSQCKMRRPKLSRILNRCIWHKEERYRIELEKFIQNLSHSLKFKVELEKFKSNLSHNLKYKTELAKSRSNLWQKPNLFKSNQQHPLSSKKIFKTF